APQATPRPLHELPAHGLRSLQAQQMLPQHDWPTAHGVGAPAVQPPWPLQSEGGVTTALAQLPFMHCTLLPGNWQVMLLPSQKPPQVVPPLRQERGAMGGPATTWQVPPAQLWQAPAQFAAVVLQHT